MTTCDLRAPFPWFGGKSRIAATVWEALGDVPNYVEPFFGSGAVLLARPHSPRIETVNDLDGMVSNFWRAVQYSPDAVISAADRPVNETDLQAITREIAARREGLQERLAVNYREHDAEIAGMWCWALCVGVPGNVLRYKPEGTASAHISGSFAGLGVRRVSDWKSDILAVANRIRRVRVMRGDWSRAVTFSTLFGNRNKLPVCGVFLDPPYAEGDEDCYQDNDQTLSASVRDWAIENGGNPQLRIVLCGHSGEHKMPSSWREVPWRRHGGWSNMTDNENKTRERLWLSPHCEGSRQRSLFGGAQ